MLRALLSLLVVGVNTNVEAAKAIRDYVYIKKSDLPSSGKEWLTLENGVEFQASENFDPQISEVRKLWGFSKEESVPFVDGIETYYDQYSQAWRLLGLYIDCDHCGGEENYNKAACIQEDDDEMEGCQRFMLWAAYVDLEYSGNEVGEYMYYDRRTRLYNDAACTAYGSNRCVKMDCHEPDTHFSLLGIFKEPDYASFMEQLFKHQGDCVWNDTEYKLMQQKREIWPEYCTQIDDGLYYDTKPIKGGNMDIALYRDSRCISEYDGSNITMEEVMESVQNDDDDNDGYYKNDRTLEEELIAWNEALDVFKYCLPCKASNLNAILSPYGITNITGDRYWYRDQYNQDDDSNTSSFVCHDDADYYDVNQCMKFQSQTTMLSASYRDVMLAESQGTVTGVTVGGKRYRPKAPASMERMKQRIHFVASIILLVLAVLFLIFALTRLHTARTNKSALRKPLLDGMRQQRRRSGDTRSLSQEF